MPADCRAALSSICCEGPCGAVRALDLPFVLTADDRIMPSAGVSLLASAHSMAHSQHESYVHIYTGLIATHAV